MPKRIYDFSAFDMLKNAHRHIEDKETYIKFLGEIADVVANYCGGEVALVGYDKWYFVDFELNDRVPDDGGIYKLYCPEVLWENGKEITEEEK